MKKSEKIEKILLEIAIQLAREGKGALFVVNDKVKYKRLFQQRIKPFSVFSKGAQKILKSIAPLDGAVIITSEGIVKDYGAMIETKKTFKGFGTRHSAAFTASEGGIAILCSEEEKKVRIFKDGKYVMQLDPLQKGVEAKVPAVVSVLEVIGAGTVGTVGVMTIAPHAGIAFLPGVLIFGVSYYALKKIAETLNLKELLRKAKIKID
ncbi:MAG: diadenylate cyclase [Candidatus Pacearchaeota archaeon]|nr:diadenylate cyclase [Candidatus Pacearchaeota archaeon]